MPPTHPAQKYQMIQVESSSPEALVVVAYDLLLKLLYTSKERLQKKEIEKSHDALKKAQMLILQLAGALNVKVWEGGKNLLLLYDYMLARLKEANLHKKVEPVDEIIPLVKDLRDTWQEAYKKLQTQKKSAVSAS